LNDFGARGYAVTEVPIEQECRKHTDDPRKGKNMWVLGMLCAIYDFRSAGRWARNRQTLRQKGRSRR
jgi:2-oxoglutarate ferredoxin oxidoreductase subunit alpha